MKSHIIQRKLTGIQDVTVSRHLNKKPTQST